MKNYYGNRNGYEQIIQRGLIAARTFGKELSVGKGLKKDNIQLLKNVLQHAQAVVIGAGAGLSTSAGLTYSGDRFEKYFFDFAAKYGISDMYSGGFYPFLDNKTRWAWWARHIYYNRYIEPPKPVYKELLSIVKDKEYFVITTNVDHQFQRAGFDKKRLFYTQGDYGLFQSVNPSIKKTYDNEEWVMQAMQEQGFIKDAYGIFTVPEDRQISMSIPTKLIPKSPDNGMAVTPNLRVDTSFVEDEGWYRASKAYSDFLKEYENSPVLYLELGVGTNTPVIVKYPFWQMTIDNQRAVYACINHGEAFCPREIDDRSLCIDGDIGEILKQIMQ